MELYQTKYYYGSIIMERKIYFHSVSDLQIHKKLNNVKEDPRRRKTDSNFDFS